MLQSSISEKKLVKPLKKIFFWTQFVIIGHAQDGKIFFGRNNKSRLSALRAFFIYENITCFDWVMNLFLSWVMVSVKKVSFPAKTAVLPSTRKHHGCHFSSIFIYFVLFNVFIFLLGFLSNAHFDIHIANYNKKICSLLQFFFKLRVEDKNT